VRKGYNCDADDLPPRGRRPAMQRLAKSFSGHAQAGGNGADGARVPLCTGAEQVCT